MQFMENNQQQPGVVWPDAKQPGVVWLYPKVDSFDVGACSEVLYSSLSTAIIAI